MLDTSSSIQLLTPKAARQAVWAVLVEELIYSVNSTSTSQLTLTLAAWTASEADTGLQRWKRKRKTAFDSKDVGSGRQPVDRSADRSVNPANIPLPRTPTSGVRLSQTVAILP
ncbi:hypothetical protein PHMEG_00039534 [Phytophthora megakarya]|uniref:Eukaryotic/viral aspartic protease n=1 Tax=Phytophthora megakarya TaxID=4795 RepID=A0A225UFD8_9STRA|nr:hypothetical protein PHMEG_00039534 [Phytophthora megakarya]